LQAATFAFGSAVCDADAVEAFFRASVCCFAMNDVFVGACGRFARSSTVEVTSICASFPETCSASPWVRHALSPPRHSAGRNTASGPCHRLWALGDVDQSCKLTMGLVFVTLEHQYVLVGVRLEQINRDLQLR
jgi:hypothetical protein